jgi:cytochrome P450
MITDIQCYSFLFVVSSLISTLLIRSIFNKPTGLHLMPSPPALPIIGHLHYLFFTPSLYSSLHRLSTKYGPLLYLRLGATRCVLVSSATLAAEIFTTHDLAFASRPIFAFADKLQFETSRFFTAPYGDYWRFMKKLSVTQLLSTRQIERSVAVRREEMERLLRRVLERKDGVVDVGAELMRLTNNVTCRMVMSSMCSKEGGEAERVRELVKESFELVEKICFGDVLGPLKNLSFWMYGKQAMDLTRRYDELLERAMKEHEEKGNGHRDDNAKADDFINRFKQQLKLQRLDWHVALWVCFCNFSISGVVKKYCLF